VNTLPNLCKYTGVSLCNDNNNHHNYMKYHDYQCDKVSLL